MDREIISKERTYVTIDIGRFRENIQNIYSHVSASRKDIKIIAVIKTDGYGHGAVKLAEALEEYPFIWGYAVATIEEAAELRKAGMKKRILVLGYVFPSAFETLIKYQITPAIFDLESARFLAEEAAKQNTSAAIHIKVDTGMSRIGLFPSEEGVTLVKQIASLKALRIEGIFTHLARADEGDPTSALRQVQKFREFTGVLEKDGIDIPLKHCANSAGIMELEATRMDLMRAGIIIYGLTPSDEVHRENVKFQPILEWKSSVAYVKTLPAGTPVSYGGTYITKRETVVATIPVGYGDGYPRLLSNRGSVLLHGRRAPIIGRVCMDQFMVDVTEIPDVRRGDEATLVGRDGTEMITMEEIAGICGTINYEIACDINRRVPRIYIE